MMPKSKSVHQLYTQSREICHRSILTTADHPSLTSWRFQHFFVQPTIGTIGSVLDQ